MDKNNQPLVTICTPCYNHESYLDDYFKSIINQTYCNMELIITDDYSSDDSRNIIRKWLPILKKCFQNVIYIENKCNLGVTKTFNKMYQLAKGKYIKPFASDDVMTTDCMEVLVGFMENHSSALVAVGNVCSVQNDYRYGEKYDAIKVCDTNYLNSIQDLHEVLLLNNVVCAVGAIYKNTLFEKCGYYDENMLHEDWDYWLTVSKTETIYFLDEIVCLYRKSDTSLSGYTRCKGKEERDKRFYITYENKKKLIEKHYKDMTDMKKKNLIKKLLLTDMYVVLEQGMKECEKMIWVDIKRNGVPLTFVEKVHCLISKYGVPLLKVRRKARDFFRRKCMKMGL